jgi:serine/threonine protein phosphatase PrpC
MSITPQRTPLARAAQASISPSANGSPWRATRWQVSAFSLKGSFHDLNQDSLHWQDGQFWGVADGVGGGAHGEVASRMLMDCMASLSAPPESAVQATLQEADRRIDAQVRALGRGPGAAVMACLWAQPRSGQWLAALVGDCKILHLQRRSRRWQCLWASPEQTYERAGQPPPPGVSPKSPANMVGCGLSAPALTHTLQVRHGERLVLCSDGFAGQLEHPDVAARVDRAGRSLASTTAQAWCEAARRAGSQDDITVLIVQRQDRLTWRTHLAILSAAALLVAGACAIVWSLA